MNRAGLAAMAISLVIASIMSTPCVHATESDLDSIWSGFYAGFRGSPLQQAISQMPTEEATYCAWGEATWRLYLQRQGPDQEMTKQKARNFALRKAHDIGRMDASPERDAAIIACSCLIRQMHGAGISIPAEAVAKANLVQPLAAFTALFTPGADWDAFAREMDRVGTSNPVMAAMITSQVPRAFSCSAVTRLEAMKQRSDGELTYAIETGLDLLRQEPP